MSTKKLSSVSLYLVLLTAGLVAGPVQAEQIPAEKPDRVEGRCYESGGLYFPKTGPNSTYGCIKKDGSGIVCGGKSAKHKRTCDTFRQVPPRLPTRWETETADQAEARSKAK